MIYDIDDPIFLPYKSPVNGWMSLLKLSRKTHSPFRMSDRLSLLIEDKTLRRQMGNEARKTALENFSIKVQMPRVAEIFEKVYRI